ncbi:LegC2/C7 family Dot/Icm T4SS effector [Legionella sp.]|uniref:LegC2/C7 family Dot/Icm T4SS effector n=1 Tax=Legionella sp. TaxID=459 RepID=UPI003C960277
MSINKKEPVHQNNLSINADKIKKVNADVVPVISEEEVSALLKAAQSDEQNNFQKIIITQEIFKKIKESLRVTIQSMEKNPSIFSRTAEFWGKLPLWQKILGGVALTLPTLILGIIAHLSFLLAICGVTTIVYTSGGIVLDDHHKCGNNVTENLAKGILNLADFMELTITALDIISQKVTMEVKKFTAENELLKINVNQLNNGITQLTGEITAAAELISSLKITKEKLEETACNLSKQVIEQGSLLEINQKELTRVTEAYKVSQLQLSNKIEEFAEIEKGLKEEIQKTAKIADYLSTVTQDISAIAIADESQKKEFHNRLTEFLQNKEVSFAALAIRFGEAEKKLEQANQLYDAQNQKYLELIEKQEKQIVRLEQQIVRLEHIGNVERAKQPANVRKIGFFDLKTSEITRTQEETMTKEFN